MNNFQEKSLFFFRVITELSFSWWYLQHIISLQKNDVIKVEEKYVFIFLAPSL
jgi:hypothetical protein